MTKKLLLHSAIFAFLLMIADASIAQQRLDSLFAPLDARYPQEKIYLQYDKSFYNPGNTVWFKAYITANNDASPISRTMYAELLDENGRLVQRKTMPILESGAASHFDLPEKYTYQKLYVRAYTPWMQNFDSSLFYLKSLPVILPQAKNAAKENVHNNSITFFPEGGDLIASLNGTVAFKAVDKNGMPISVTGNIIDAAGKKITGFSSTHDGMGTFALAPIQGEKYNAVWKDKSGKETTTALPEVKTDGIAISIKKSTAGITYTISKQPTANDRFKNLTVFAQMHNQLAYMAKLNLQVKNEVTATINTAEMPDGILQITIFNAEQVPVAERIVFVSNNQYFFNTDLHFGRKKYHQAWPQCDTA